MIVFQIRHPCGSVSRVRPGVMGDVFHRTDAVMDSSVVAAGRTKMAVVGGSNLTVPAPIIKQCYNNHVIIQ